MTTDRFDPTPDLPYGSCVTCGITLEAREDAQSHMKETLVAGKMPRRSHTTRSMNPTREDRIEREVRFIVEDAIQDAIDEIERLVEQGHITRDEATKALRDVPGDFTDAWEAIS